MPSVPLFVDLVVGFVRWLLPWDYVMEVSIGPAFVDERTMALVPYLQEPRSVDGFVPGEFLELSADVITYAPIGVVGTISAGMTLYRRRR